jgi:hypothetical protein
MQHFAPRTGNTIRRAGQFRGSAAGGHRAHHTPHIPETVIDYRDVRLHAASHKALPELRKS